MKTLSLNPNNPREISKAKFDELKKSLKEFSKMLNVRPIVYDENDVIIGGNQRYIALQQLESEGLITVDDKWFVQAVGWSEEDKKQFVIKDNAHWGEWDYDKLANEWDDMPLADWGINTDSWKEEDITEDQPPEVSTEESKSIRGKVYQLGRHRLMCGDSANVEDARILMGGGIG